MNFCGIAPTITASLNSQPYADFKKYILDNRFCEREGIDGIDGDLMDFHEIIQNDVPVSECFQYFVDRKYPLDSLDKINSFMQLIMNAHNNTRMYGNNGFTPAELFEKFERPELRSLPKEPFDISGIKKAGRNESCPCGSGLKYKKCHGK
ncbi:MAG: SEC-C metal-binding domain-containing protein [Firmicutes bacterium]|nr:SEC-C metal-binding domain-containing protein [Bacillota bacterium]